MQQLETERPLVENNKQLIALNAGNIAMIWGGGASKQVKLYDENKEVRIAVEG